MTEINTPVRVPDVIFKTRIPVASRDESTATTVCDDTPFSWQDRTTSDIFGNKKIVLFALPGAFTPTCSAAHVPGYEKHYDEFRSLGVDEVICLSVNDAYVMERWSKELGVEKVYMLPDGNTDFTRGMGMLVKKENLGFGERSWRYSMYIEDGEIKKMFVEPGKADNAGPDPFEVSDADTMLEYLKEK